MEFSLFESLSRLNIIGVTILGIAGILLFCFVLSNSLIFPYLNLSYLYIFLLVLSSSFVGSAIRVVDNLAPLIRWISIFLLLTLGLLQERPRASLGLILFWGYVVLGFGFLFRAISPNWQFQKSLLLIAVAGAIPFAYSNTTYKSLKLSLVSISVAATIYSLFNFISLPSHLSIASRFTGYSKGAPSFALFLGGLLPFTFWGLFRATNRAIKIACGSGFLFGLVTLISSGQRTGTVAGVIGLIPLLLTFLHRKMIKYLASIMILLFLLGYVLFQQSSSEMVNFLRGRYSLDSGLSGRELIWHNAFSEIRKNPFLGRGIGATESVISHSFHNAYLEVWFNTGFVGLLFFLGAQFCFAYRVIYLNRKCKDPEFKSILALALGYMIGFIVMCIFESIGAGASNLNLVLYLFLGALVSNDHLINTQLATTRNPIQ